MSKGLGKLEAAVLKVLAEDKLAQMGGLNIMLLAWRVGIGWKPSAWVEHGQIVEPAPEELAAHAIRLQSLRRALRSLRRKGLVVAVSGIETDRRAYIYMLPDVADRLLGNSR